MKICPHLGLIQDPQTPAIFPSERNFCHGVQPALAVLDSHQKIYCLAQAHETCPVFIDKNSAAKREFLYRPSVTERSRAFAIPLLFGFFAVLFVLLAIWYYGVGLPPAESEPAPVATVLSPAPEAPTLADFAPLATLLETPIASLTPTNTPLSPTGTASIMPPPALETPIGIPPGFLIHRVLSGESLTFLATRYNTTAEAIRAVNFYLPLPLWENWLVVIPFESAEVGGLPPFEVYQVNQDDLTVSMLAEQLEVDAALLALHNNLRAGDILVSGQWVLVPRVKP